MAGCLLDGGVAVRMVASAQSAELPTKGKERVARKTYEPRAFSGVGLPYRITPDNAVLYALFIVKPIVMYTLR